MTRNKHTHQFKRINLARSENKPYYVYKCQQTNCPTYYTPELVVGKLSICPRCSETFEIELYHLELVFPYCSNCRRNKEVNV